VRLEKVMSVRRPTASISVRGMGARALNRSIWKMLRSWPQRASTIICSGVLEVSAPSQ
jgi:hypothetical protein